MGSPSGAGAGPPAGDGAVCLDLGGWALGPGSRWWAAALTGIGGGGLASALAAALFAAAALLAADAARNELLHAGPASGCPPSTGCARPDSG